MATSGSRLRAARNLNLRVCRSLRSRTDVDHWAAHTDLVEMERILSRVLLGLGSSEGWPPSPPGASRYIEAPAGRPREGIG